ncbi:AAA family ATPase [Pseudomonas sp. RL_15y_Pfl2_60]|uniref:AAA family ATPase n=1 Tax=Pseudomonas sp. RL_15y_Pfl2_60 TaxID=3088709 RepID=UPI0030DA0FA2
MFKISEVRIDDFWHRLNAKCGFNEDVNIIIGRNGTGKTTFMNILHSALTVDLDGLAENDFSEILIKLKSGTKNRVVRVTKLTHESAAFHTIEYKISSSKYILRAISADDVRYPTNFKKRMLESASEVKNHLSKIISLSSLSVYRLKSTEDFEIKDRSGKRLISPVDFRLMQLRGDLTKYQFDLSVEARQISSNLQKDVLTSILFTDPSSTSQIIPSKFDKEKEQSQLVGAYARLGAIDTEVRRKIARHIVAIDTAVKLLASNRHEGLSEKDFAAVEAYFRTQKIVSMSLKAEEHTKEIFSPIDLFTSILKDFIPDKIFGIYAGELKVLFATPEREEIPISKLSSGEKQLIILLAEALLQRGEHYVYLADEPELSLHIEWQRKILPAIKQLNPNSQIIAATHSPEVASKYRSHIIDMKDVVNG